MEQRQKHALGADLRSAQMSNALKKLYSDSGGQPVRLSADRVPTFTLPPSNESESSKVVLNKHGWNPHLKLLADQDGTLRSRSILREPNANFLPDDDESRLASRPPEAVDVPPTFYDGGKKLNEQIQHTSVASGLHFKTSDMKVNGYSDPSLGKDQYQRTGRIAKHLYSDASIQKSDTAFKSVSRNEMLPVNVGRSDELSVYDQKSNNLHVNFRVNDERPILLSCSHDPVNKGYSSDAKGHRPSKLVEDELGKYKVDAYERTGTDKSEQSKRTRIGMKLQQHRDQKGQDGLERVRQLIAMQRAETKDAGTVDRHDVDQTVQKRTTCSADAPLVKGAGHFQRSADPQAGDIAGLGAHGVYLSSDIHDVTSRSLHRSDDPVRQVKKLKSDHKTVSFPRKVAQAPTLPSYRGFSEVVSHKTSAVVDPGTRSEDDPKKKKVPTATLR